MKVDYALIYKLVAAIPRGKVATYGQIALWLGTRSARTVAWALRAAPPGLRLPCHRVVNKKGHLSPAHVFGGKDRQRKLLENEGVTFLLDGRIDLSHCLWSGPAIWEIDDFIKAAKA